MKGIKKKSTLVFTGGGTAGHIFPGLAVLEALRAFESGRDISLAWIGSGKTSEKKLVEGFSIPFLSIPAGKFRRYFSFRNFTDLFRIMAGFFASLMLLCKLKPFLLFSKGGYVSVPPILAARVLRIPVWVHESDLDPGLATRLGARWAEKIFVSYRETRGYFPEILQNRIILSGNPVRKAIFGGNREEGRRIANCRGNEPLLLVLGGSQGARQINNLLGEIIESLTPHCSVVHQMGREEFKPSQTPGYTTSPFFFQELPHLLCAADLIVCRAGAGTLWENAVLGKPALLIPLGTGSSRGDQIRNAEYFTAAGASQVLKTEETEGQELKKRILDLLQKPEVLMEMGNKAKALAPTKASELIASEILKKKGEIYALHTN